MEDGTSKTGFVLSFDDKTSFYYNNSDYQILFGSPENNSGLAKEFYYFKKDEKSEDEKIKLIDIKRITVEQPELYSGKIKTNVYEKVKIAKPNNDLTLDFKEKPILLPIFFSNEKLTIYNFTEMLCKGNSINSCSIKGYNYYFLPKNAEYAVKPFEITAGTIFSMKKIGPKIYKSFEFMGKECPIYLEHLSNRKSKYDESFCNSVNKEFNNTFKANQAKYDDDLKKAKKSMSNDDFTKYEIDKKIERIDESNKMFYNAIFNDEIVDYINSCE